MTNLLFIYLSNQSFLTGNQKVTFHEYEETKIEDRKFKPLFCELDYNQVDLRFVTAIEGIERHECKKCLEVKSAKGSKIFVLGVDRGGKGLDMSKFAFNQLFGQTHLGLDDAIWTTVDDKFCSHIYKY